MSTIAIGDIHGSFAALESLLDVVLSGIQRDDTLVFLGDTIDRGPDSKKCVELIRSLVSSASFEVVTLLGNHEEWMLATLDDFTKHSWLLNIEAFDTITSYSPDAAERIRAALVAAGPAVIVDRVELPYELFFDSVPASHLEFFRNLKRCHQTEDVLCVHGGLDPNLESIEEQRPRDMTWGCEGFPERYRGTRPVVYGHKNFRDTDDAGRPVPHVLANETFGIDTLSSGVLTAMRFPDGKIIQTLSLIHI